MLVPVGPLKEMPAAVTQKMSLSSIIKKEEKDSFQPLISHYFILATPPPPHLQSVQAHLAVFTSAKAGFDEPKRFWFKWGRNDRFS